MELVPLPSSTTNSTVPNEFIERFGSPAYFRDSFRGIEYSDLDSEFSKLDQARGKQCEQYEATRQHFLRLLGRDRLIWHPTDLKYDLNVHISRICRRDQEDYVAFMRIRPQGYRSERSVPPGTEIVFHLLYGQVIFNYRKRGCVMKKGSHRVVQARSTYSIRCCYHETAYFIFRIVKHSPRKQATHKPLEITID